MSIREVSLPISLVSTCYWMTCPLRKSPNISSPVYCNIVTRHERLFISEAVCLCAWRLEAMCIQPYHAQVPKNQCFLIPFAPSSHVLYRNRLHSLNHRMEMSSSHGEATPRSVSPPSRSHSARSGDVQDQAADHTPQSGSHLIGRFDWEQHESLAEHPNGQEHLWPGVSISRSADSLGQYHSTETSKDDVSVPKLGKYSKQVFGI